jgi:para-aminobenzoate synthetase component I
MLSLRFDPRVRALPSPPDTERLLAFCAEHQGAALDSASGEPRRGSLFVFDPLDAGPLPTDVIGLRAYVGQLEPVEGDALPGPFAGGFVGALSYDMGVHGEDLALPADPWGWPPILGGLFTDFVWVDHQTDEAWLVLGDVPGDGRPSVAERTATFWAAMDSTLADPNMRPSGPLERHTTAPDHEARIERVRDRIAEGEVYQVNLAHRYSRPMVGAPVDLYRRLRALNPAPWMGFLTCEHGAILSSSPELLMESQDGNVRTRPIKGTIGRGTNEDEDAAARATLLASAKDRAELAMIVDLERNDLGRIARTGSVQVDGFPTLETYASVHHLVADVRAELAPGLDTVDAIAALFPGGSITGAPKLRSMEVLAELEEDGRGYFTGSLGFLDVRGSAAFNILIRTLVWRPRPGPGAGEVSFHVGGGITWRSDPVAEELETRVKGAALAASMAGRDEVQDTLGVNLTLPG